MPGEFSNPGYVNPGTTSGQSAAVLSVADAAARLAIIQGNAVGRIVKQASDSTIWCLKPSGLASQASDWEFIGYFSLGSMSFQNAGAVEISGGSITGVEIGVVTFSDAAGTREALGLGDVDNTPDLEKPVSEAQALAIGDAFDEAVAAAALDATSKANLAYAGALAAAASDATTKANAAQAAAIAALSFGNTAPTNGYETLVISGVTNPAGINGFPLVVVDDPISNLYYSGTQWSSDGNAAHPPSGDWVTVYPWMLATAAEATLAEIAPPENYVASVSQSSASEIQLFRDNSWEIYWLYAGSPTRWVDAGEVGLADMGSTVIEAGTAISCMPGSAKIQGAFVGGLGETWETATDAEYVWLVLPRIDGAGVGSFRGIGSLPENAAYAAFSPAAGVPVVMRESGVGATATPPFIRVHGGKVYLQESGVWKEFNLSPLS